MANTIETLDGVQVVTTDNNGVPVTTIAGADLGSLICFNAAAMRTHFLNAGIHRALPALPANAGEYALARDSGGTFTWAIRDWWF